MLYIIIFLSIILCIFLISIIIQVTRVEKAVSDLAIYIEDRVSRIITQEEE